MNLAACSDSKPCDTPTLRGVNVQRLFGSQRALKTVEDFTEFEQRAAYFDGDIATAAKKGVNPLERGSQGLQHVMLSLRVPVDPATLPVPPLNARVTDQTGTLDAAQVQALESQLAGIETSLGSQIVVLMIPSTQGEDIAAYAFRVADQWDSGNGMCHRRLFVELAVSVAAAVAFSALLALSLSPMLASKLLRPAKGEGWLARNVDGAMHRLKDSYHASLEGLLGRRSVSIGASADAAHRFETIFAANGWGDGWRNGIHSFLHFHTSTHEVLGIAAGQAIVQFGGGEGRALQVQAGDVVALPAGVGHQRLQALALDRHAHARHVHDGGDVAGGDDADLLGLDDAARGLEADDLAAFALDAGDFAVLDDVDAHGVGRTPRLAQVAHGGD